MLGQKRGAALKSTGRVLADIYRRKISNWNDAAMADLDSGLTLPDKKVIPSHRAENSGTKYILFDFWRKEVATGSLAPTPGARLDILRR
jgi:phosphate transport system substrate-binding protein